jgi:hypothetical protein
MNRGGSRRRVWVQGAALLAVVSLGFPVAAKDKKESKEEAEVSPVILRVDGEDVTKAEFDEMIKGNERFYDLTSPTVRDKLHGKPLSEYLFREEILKIKAVSHENKDALPAMKEAADAALAKIQGGADFGDVAKEVSQDAGTAPQGGVMLGQEFFKLVPPFNRIALSAKQGEVKGPVLTIFGYHLLKVEKIYPPMEMKPRRVDMRHILIKFPSASGDFRQKVEEWTSAAKVEILDKSYCKKLPSFCEAGSGS